MTAHDRDPESHPPLPEVEGLPRSIEPRDLWPGIARQMAADRRRRGLWVVIPALAAAALLLLVPRSATLPGRALTGHPEITASGVRTDDSSSARLDLTIGTLDVEPGTRLRILGRSDQEQRFALERGSIVARVTAPPRVFVVETPSSVVTDLGCAYTLEVDSLGNGLLHVTAGIVEFAAGGRRAIVPVDARAETRAGVGPGTPYVDDAPEELKRALEAFDFGSGGGAALAVALHAARAADGLSLWHLLSRVSLSQRGAVYDRLALLVPPPAGVTRAGVLGLDQGMLDLWWNYVPRTVLRPKN